MTSAPDIQPSSIVFTEDEVSTIVSSLSLTLRTIYPSSYKCFGAQGLTELILKIRAQRQQQGYQLPAGVNKEAQQYE